MVQAIANFTTIDLSHKDRIDKIRKNNGHILSSHAFSSLYLWKDKMNLKVYLSEELFCVKCGQKDANEYFFPCGAEDEKRLIISELLDKDTLIFRYLRDEDREFLEKYFPGRFYFESIRDDWEYIYDKEEQISLKGSSFKHLRSKVHRGEQAHKWTIISLTKDTTPLATEVATKWHTEIKHNGESVDIGATLNALEFMNELSLSGILLMDGDKPLAFALGTAITEDTFDLHISKTLEDDIDFYLKWELYRWLPKNIRYINREEDLGLEGLRLHKTEMKPIRFNELWKGCTKTE